MSEDILTPELDVEEAIREKIPNKKIPKLIVNYLKKIVHQNDLNEYFKTVPGQKGIPFIDSTLKKFGVTVKVSGIENLPPKEGKYIFVSNHPLGGLDGITLGKVIGEHYDGKVKFLANDFLMFVDQLKDMFIPINKVGTQSKNVSMAIDEFFESDNHLITFPAGACSRKIHGEIKDYDWKKTFVIKAVHYQRDVVPIYFEARNSNFFYNLSNWRIKLGIKLNVEMMYLVDEMYKQHGNVFKVKIGKPISYHTFDKSKTPAGWANWVRKKVYSMQ